jgi:hypothetical protein
MVPTLRNNRRLTAVYITEGFDLRFLVERGWRQVMRALFANLTSADFRGSSKTAPSPEERQRVHVLFDEIQVAIYNNDRERVDLLMVKLALATTHRQRTSS